MENLGRFMMNRVFWKDKKVFLTGHTGFKGAWLSLWLQDCGAILAGYALAPNTTPNLFDSASVANGMESVIGDVRDLEKLTKTMKYIKNYSLTIPYFRKCLDENFENVVEINVKIKKVPKLKRSNIMKSIQESTVKSIKT